jgi:predicted nucleic acid-binding protein
MDLAVDASVVFKWLIPDAAEDDVPAAKALLADHMEGRAKIVVPPLLYYEVGNILLFGRSRPPIEDTADALTDLFAIPLEVAPSTLVSAHGTLRLASDYSLSYYDATYVMLAEMLDCLLITADRRIVRAMGASGHVQLLGKS